MLIRFHGRESDSSRRKGIKPAGRCIQKRGSFPSGEGDQRRYFMEAMIIYVYGVGRRGFEEEDEQPTTGKGGTRAPGLVRAGGHGVSRFLKLILFCHGVRT